MIARGGEVELLTLSDRLRPPGIGFGVGWIHVYPSTLYSDTLREAERVAVHAVHALGLRDGIAFPQVIAADGRGLGSSRSRRGSRADRWPTWPGTRSGVDLVEVALRQALGEPVPDELARPRFQQPLAIRFLTAEPGPLPTGKVRSWSGLERVLRVSRGRPGGRLPDRGRGDPAGAARRRPARLRDRGRPTRTSRRSSAPRRRRGCWTSRWSPRELRVRPRALPGAARGGAGRRLPLRPLRGRPAAGRRLPAPRRRPLARRRRCAWPSSRREAGAAATYFLMTRERLLQPGLAARARGRSRGCASSGTTSASTRSGRGRRRATSASRRCSPGTTPTPST